MRGKRKRFLFIMHVVFLVAVLVGCEFEETNYDKIKDLDYTVCDEGKLPDELVNRIREKKTEPFKLTYRTKDYLYIVVGYGAQDRTDLSVIIKELYLTENAIFVDTELSAEAAPARADSRVTYPWIAVKCELYDVQVNFK